MQRTPKQEYKHQWYLRKKNWFRGDRYPVYFNRIVAPVFEKDINDLRQYDIRQIFADNAIKDIVTEVDKEFMEIADNSTYEPLGTLVFNENA